MANISVENIPRWIIAALAFSFGLGSSWALTNSNITMNTQKIEQTKMDVTRIENKVDNLQRAYHRSNEIILTKLSRIEGALGVDK